MHKLPVRSQPVATWRLTWLLAVVVAITAILGMWHGGDGWYGGYAASLAGLVGQDFVSLAVGLPVLLASAALARRGSVAGLLVWAGALFYFAYTYAFVVVGGFNPVFPLFVLIVALGLHGLVSLLLTLDPERVRERFGAATPVRLAGGYLFTIGAVFAVMWTGMSVAMITAGKTPEPVLHLVVAIDGCVLLPALLAGGWKGWHRAAWGFALGGLLLTKVTLTGFSLAFTTLLGAVWTGSLDGFNGFLLVLFGLMAVTGLPLLLVYLRRIEPEPREADGAVAAAKQGT